MEASHQTNKECAERLASAATHERLAGAAPHERSAGATPHHGILLIDKPPEHTSFDVIARLRGASGIKKIGHTGTLDPMATGVLPILFGRAARLADLLPDTTKTYEAAVKLGIRTDTLDITGKILEQRDSQIESPRLLEIMDKFRGDIEQIPPMYSAVKIGGKRLYDLAREGKEVERKPRKATIYSLNLLEFCESEQTFKISVHCSAGTYIRTLCDDIGRMLDTGAVMTDLRRTTACGFDIQQCVTLEECLKSGVISHIRPAEFAVLGYPKTDVSPVQARMFRNGVKLDMSRLRIREQASFYRVYSEGIFLGLAGERQLILNPDYYSDTKD